MIPTLTYWLTTALLLTEALLLFSPRLPFAFRAYLLIPIASSAGQIYFGTWALWDSAGAAALLSVAELLIAVEAVLLASYCLYARERAGVRWFACGVGAVLAAVALLSADPYPNYPAALFYLMVGRRLVGFGLLSVALGWLALPRTYAAPRWRRHATILWLYFLPWVLFAGSSPAGWWWKNQVMLAGHLGCAVAWLALAWWPALRGSTRADRSRGNPASAPSLQGNGADARISARSLL